MQVPEAYAYLSKFSSEQLRQVLSDASQEDTLRGVAALIMAGRRDAAVEENARWLVWNWDFATPEVKKYILDALGYCPSSQSVEFLNAQVTEPTYQLTAIASLARLKEESILPYCYRLIHFGTELQCVHAIAALSQIGTPDAIELIEFAMRSGSSERVRQVAAETLARPM